MHDEQSSCDTQLIRQVAGMGVRLDTMLEARKAESETLQSIGKRIGDLETRMGQVVLVGFLVTLLAPVAGTIGAVAVTAFFESHHPARPNAWVPKGQQAKQL